MSPDWLIEGTSDDDLAAILTERATIAGRHIFNDTVSANSKHHPPR